MEQKAPGMGWSTAAVRPFTFIRTRWLDYPQLLQLKRDGVGGGGLLQQRTVRQSNRNGCSRRRLLLSPFFLDFGAWKVEHQLHLIPQGIAERCTTLWDLFIFPATLSAEQEGLLHDLCLFDLCLHTKPQKLPERAHHPGKPALPRSNSRAVS